MSAAAWVHGVPLDVSAVDERERAVRSGPRSAALPARSASEGRQFRRWLVQLLCAERLVDEYPVCAESPPLARIAPDRAALLRLGSVAAALLAGSARARAVFVEVTSDVRISEAELATFRADNPVRHQESRVVRHALLTDPSDDPQLAERPLWTLRRGGLVGAVEDAVFTAEVGDVVGPIRGPLGWHVLSIERTEPPTAEDTVPDLLLAAARRRAFTAWLDQRLADDVRLAPGYEHPGDPSQPDNTHRH